MTSTKLGREVLGHRCTYSCDCPIDDYDEWLHGCPSVEFIDALPDEPLDSAHCPRTVNPGAPSTFAAVVVTVAAGGLLAMGALVVVLNWLGVL